MIILLEPSVTHPICIRGVRCPCASLITRARMSSFADSSACNRPLLGRISREASLRSTTRISRQMRVDHTGEARPTVGYVWPVPDRNNGSAR